MTDLDRDGEQFLNSERNFHDLLMNVTQIAVILDIQGKISFCNNFLLKLTGWQRAEVMGQNWFTLFLPDKVREQIGELFVHSVKTGTIPAHHENEIITRKGELRSVAWDNTLLRDKKGNITGTASLGVDITDNKRSEEEKDHFIQVLEASPIAITIHDTDGNFIYSNDRALSSHGYTREEFTALNLNMVDVPKDARLLGERINTIINCGEAAFEVEHFHKDGSIIPLQVNAKYVKWGDKNVILTIGTDIRDRKRMEKELEEESVRRRKLFEQAPYGILIIDPQTTKFVEFNSVAHQQLGYTREEFANLSIFDIEARETPAEIKATIAGVFQMGKTDFETIHRTKKGELRSVNVNAQIIENNGQTIYQCFWQDITERKRVEDEISQKEEQFTTIFNFSPIAMSLSTIESGTFLNVNEAFEKLSGYSREELIGKTALELGVWIVDKDRQQVIQYVAANGFLDGREIKYRIKGGKIIDTKIKIRLLEIGDKKYLLLIIEDITERKQFEDQIKTLSRSVEQSPVIVVITDPAGTIEYVNPKFSESTGYAFEEAVGRNPRILRSGLTPASVYKSLWTTVLSGKEWRGEFCNKRKNGEIYWEDASISPMFDEEGQIIHFVAVKEEITARKKMEQDLIAAKENAEEMNRLKSSFLANMSHELRTPMIGILGYSQLLEQELVEKQTKRYAHIINDSGKRLMETLNLILNLSRIEAGKQEINLSLVEIIGVINEELTLFEEMAHNNSLSLKIDTKLQAVLVSLDEQMFRQIINNLVNNALKYTEKGEVVVGIRTEYNDNMNYVVIAVRDTGIGIKKEYLKIIWDEFRQISEGRARNFEGTGLGLSITKKFTEKLKGEISVESEPDKGSTFKVSFPVDPEKITPKPDRPVDPDDYLSEVEDSGKSLLPLLLYVEDDPIAINFVSTVLENHYRLDIANNSKTALEKVTEQQYAAILMDINLGRDLVDGVQTTRIIRQFDAYRDVPIIAVTAYAMVGDREEFMQAGCTHYLSKPFRIAELIAVLKDALGN